MNYYNPYFYTLPNMTAAPRMGLLGRIFGNSRITLGSILNGTQRVLNFANQAIPLAKQVRPIVGNAKTMLKVMNEFKRVEKPKKSNNSTIVNQYDNNNNISIKNENHENNTEYNNGPTFFM